MKEESKNYWSENELGLKNKHSDKIHLHIHVGATKDIKRSLNKNAFCSLQRGTKAPNYQFFGRELFIDKDKMVIPAVLHEL
jgi:hypothetical protein